MNNDETEKIKSPSLSTSFFCLSFLIAAIIFIVYYQTTDFSFVNIDDHLYVEENSHVQKGLNIETIQWAFTDATHITNFWAPLTWLSILIDYEFHGMNPGGYHLTNTLLHILNSLILLLLFFKMTGALWRSFFIAAMFALHPLHVESVAWITERKDVLSALFWLLTMLSYFFYTKSPGNRRLLITLCCFILGLMAKPMLVTLPFALILMDYWPLKRLQPSTPVLFFQSFFRLFREKILFFILVVLVSFATYLTQDRGDVLQPLSNITPQLRVENIIVSYVSYLWKTVWPFNLSVAYPYPDFLPLWMVLISLCIILAGSFLSILFYKKHPWFIAGWLWYLGTLVPVIGIVVIADQAMADRYTYIPHIGIFIIMAWGIPELLKNLPNRNAILMLLSCSMIFFMAVATWNQTRYWKNSETLFRHAISVNENSFLAYNNLGLQLLQQGNMQEASELLKKSIKIKPLYANAYINLGVVLESLGRADEAIQLYTIATELKPGFITPYINLAFVLLSKNKIEEAMRYCFKAIEIDPDFTEAYILLGDAYGKLGKTSEADRMYRKALNLDFNSASAHNRMGNFLLKNNKISEAVFHFQTALKIVPDNNQYRKNLKIALDIMHKIDFQIGNTLNAIHQKPDNPIIYNILGELYQQKGQQEKAIQQFQKAIAMDPELIPALQNMAFIHAKNNEYDESISYFKKLIFLQPDKNVYLYNIACLYAKKNETGKALHWLKEAIDKGYNNWELIKMDKDLEFVRKNPEYQKLLK